MNKKIQEKNHLALLGMAGLCTFAFVGHTVATWQGRFAVQFLLLQLGFVLNLPFRQTVCICLLAEMGEGAWKLLAVPGPHPPPPCLRDPSPLGVSTLGNWVAVNTLLEAQSWAPPSLRHLSQVHQLADFKWGYINKQLLDEIEHDIMNYQNRGLCYLPKPKAEADNTDTRFW